MNLDLWTPCPQFPVHDGQPFILPAEVQAASQLQELLQASQDTSYARLLRNLFTPTLTVMLLRAIPREDPEQESYQSLDGNVAGSAMQSS